MIIYSKIPWSTEFEKSVGLVIHIFFEKVKPLLLQTTDNACPVDFELQKTSYKETKLSLDHLQKTSLDQL